MQTESGGVRKLVELARDAERRGDVPKALGLYDDAIEALEREQDLALLADALRWKGTVHREQGETEVAYRCYAQSLIHAEKCGSPGSRAHALNCLAIIAQRRGKLAESEKLYTEAGDFANRAGDVRLLGMIEQNRGVLLNMRGNFVAAEARYSNSLAAFERSHDDEAVSWVLNNLGMLYTKLGHYQRAIETFERGLAIARARGDSLVQNVLMLNLALVWVTTGKLDIAERACATALEDARVRGDHLTIAEALKCRARIERERGALEESIASLRIGIFEAEGLEDRLLQAELLREFGQTSRALGNSADARLAWSDAAESFEDVGARHEAAEINALLSSLPS
ncbi:MAG TPA: tetratricopeptide repeat protein [Gemmatimonadaceae bacterium]|nr:tetratricopeptide repeat protein [Gemmatimonadaceae bacterium]